MPRNVRVWHDPDLGAYKYSPWPFSDWPLLTALRSIETSADGGAGGGPSASRCWTHPRAEAPFPSPAPGEFARLERGAPAPNGVGCCQARRRALSVVVGICRSSIQNDSGPRQGPVQHGVAG